MNLKIAVEKIKEDKVDDAGRILVYLYLKHQHSVKKPDDFQYVRLNLARVYEKKEEFLKAEFLLKEILTQDKKFYSAWHLLGKIYEKFPDKKNSIDKAVSAFSKIPESSPNYKSAKKYLKSVKTQQSIDEKIKTYEGKELDYFDFPQLADLSLLVKDIDNVEICSQKDAYYVRIAEIYSRVKEESRRKKQKDGTPLHKINNSDEMKTLDMVLSLYMQKAGFDI
jgi:tetratricopeptide (TPR) repeat protein